MRKGTFIILGLLVIAVTAVCGLWLSQQRPRPPNPPEVAVSFAGYSNDAAGVRLATFTVVNGSISTIRRWGRCRIEGQAPTHLIAMLALGPDVSVASGQTEKVAVPAPTNQGAWRVTFFCERDGWRRRLRDFAADSPLLSKNYRIVPDQCAPHSEWMEP
jgi:hypothetical protein